MSNPDEADTCKLDLYPESTQETQETYYEGATNESFKINDETQNTNLNESQDFNLIVSEGDDSMVEQKKKMQNEKESNLQKSVERKDLQTPELSPETPQMADKNVNSNESKDEAVEKKGDVSGELEKKDDHSDEDEDVIQGTPPQNYSPSSRKISGVDVTPFSLKRKIRTADELPLAKMLRTKDATNVEKPSGEESCNSDDSYQELFKNIDKNVVIEETQDLTNPEFTQNSLKIPATEHAADKPETHTEQNDSQRDETAFSEKNDNSKTKLINDSPSVVLRDYSRDDSQLNESTTATVADESLSVSSAKLSDISANDSTIVNINSVNGDSSQPGDDLPVEIKADVASASDVTTDEASGTGTKSVKDIKISDKKNEVEKLKCVESTAERTVDDNNDEDEEIPSSQTKSRTSVELIFEGANNHRAASDGDGKSKPQVVQIDDDGEKILDSSVEMAYDRSKGTRTPKPEVVQIDDSHEKIVLDLLGKSAEIQVTDKSSYESKSSSHDNSYRSMESMKESSLDSKLTGKRLVNGSSDFKKSDADATLSVESDASSVSDEITVANDVKKTDDTKVNFMDNIDFISISDHETSTVEEKSKSDLSAPIKTMQVEREVSVYLKLKCLLHVDENTKEPVSKELTAVHCEPVIIEPRQKGEDSSLDISDKIDSSPGSVNSNPQLYTLNPCRLSILSSISSSSSASSAASLQAKIARNSHFFSIPLGPAKHAKKSSQDTLPDRQMLNDTYDQLTREWKNHHLLTETILNYTNTELSGITTGIAAATASVVVDMENMNNERLDDPHPHHHLTVKSNNMRSSTPSEQPATTSKVEPVTTTPKSTKKGKAVKRPRSKLAKSNANINAQINREDGDKISDKPHASESDTPSRAKKSKTVEQDDTLNKSDGNLEQSHSNSMLNDVLIGCNVFAKWSDNNYYPGMVSNRLKDKYKVNFYDGKSKVLIPEFVIPIPKTLREGLSVYATTKTNDYSFPSIIVDVQTTSGGDTYYTVETDEGERLRVQLPNISLTADQAQVLKEEVEDSTGKSSLPSTPKALAQVTLDNMVDGKRRSKRLGAPLFSTPKSATKNIASTSIYKASKSEPSVSGISSTKATVGSENEEGISSDSNIESIQPLVQDKYAINGTQREIIGSPYEQIMKGGPLSKIKSKPRSKKKKACGHEEC
ncbi:uncharacterized protein LOC105834472 isoform X2 [Monomorium pharaonis]|uniref:uncharacterized protein LOC105834472 isoform X2 n=1 Tax=Monomorium pharaonis TaxID=307658 RepID=UPI00063F0FB7|nr:uncharacterized protein LOC105834472 isoform X2 [Monomorium pharaonis]